MSYNVIGVASTSSDDRQCSSSQPSQRHSTSSAQPQRKPQLRHTRCTEMIGVSTVSYSLTQNIVINYHGLKQIYPNGRAVRCGVIEHSTMDPSASFMLSIYMNGISARDRGDLSIRLAAYVKPGDAVSHHSHATNNGQPGFTDFWNDNSYYTQRMGTTYAHTYTGPPTYAHGYGYIMDGRSPPHRHAGAPRWPNRRSVRMSAVLIDPRGDGSTGYSRRLKEVTVVNGDTLAFPVCFADPVAIRRFLFDDGQRLELKLTLDVRVPVTKMGTKRKWEQFAAAIAPEVESPRKSALGKNPPVLESIANGWCYDGLFLGPLFSDEDNSFTDMEIVCCTSRAVEDCGLVTETHSFWVHKFVLARHCRKFFGELYFQARKCDCSVEISSLELMSVFLRVLYNSDCLVSLDTLSVSQLIELYKLAMDWQARAIAAEIESRLSSAIGCDSLAEILRLAAKSNLYRLVDDALRFAAVNKVNWKHERNRQLLKEYPHLLVELLAASKCKVERCLALLGGRSPDLEPGPSVMDFF